jgi:hypothetical protein
MQNRLTRALGCGDIASVSEYNRITEAILNDNWLYNEVMKTIVAERGVEIIQQAPPMVRDKFLQRIRFVKPAAQIRIKWEFIPPHATAKQESALLRARRYFGESKTHEEQLYWRPQNDAELAAVKEPWTGTVPSPEVIEEYKAYLHAPDPAYVGAMREAEINAQESAAKKQGQQMSGELGAAVNIQKGAHPGQFVDNSKENEYTPPTLTEELIGLTDLMISKLEAKVGGRK